ncbi:MAG: transposase [Lentisphaerae bacterium]|nr:transposase [Lentisphaerota bacterium]
MSGIRSVLERLHADGDMRLLCATTMPDHLHIVFELTERLAVGPVIGKLKAITKPALADVGASWQRGFFDHRLRPDERSDAYARYVFLNPYRQDLIKRDTTWAAWMMGTGVDFDFVHLLDAGGLPPVEWIAAGFEELGIRAEDVGEGECVDDTGSGMRE